MLKLKKKDKTTFLKMCGLLGKMNNGDDEEVAIEADKIFHDLLNLLEKLDFED